jgi:hypothetical protein
MSVVSVVLVLSTINGMAMAYETSGGGSTYYSNYYSYYRGPFYVSMIISLSPVDRAQCGQSVKLEAHIKNTGHSALRSDAKVWFYVDGPNWSGSHWVGYASVAGLTQFATQLYSFDWTIPSDASSKAYRYWARVWSPSAGYLSSWSNPQSFTVSYQTKDHPDSCSNAINITQLATAQVINGNLEYTINGSIDKAGDSDRFKFPSWTWDALGFSTTGSTDTYGVIYDIPCPGTLITQDDNSGAGYNFAIGLGVYSGRAILVKVSHANPNGTGDYTLKVTFDPWM